MRKDKNTFNILVVEDNPGDFILVEDFLTEQIQHPVITHVKNFRQALSVLNEGKNCFDVILLDLTLPDKSGHDLIKEMLPLTEKSPVIILTGYPDIDSSIQSISEGISDYLIKDDLNAVSLYKSIIYCIERRKGIQQLKESEKRYSDLFRLNPQPMWLYDPETMRFVQVNQAAIDHYGYTEQEFLNMTILDIRPEEDIQKVKARIANYNSKTNKVHIGNFRHYKKSKELIEVEIYSNMVMIKEKQYRLVIATDVTEKTLFEHTITRAIIKAQENERYEIGAELHDNVCQILATSQMSLGMLKQSLTSSAMPLFDQSNNYITLAIQEIRNLSHQLAPAFINNSTLESAFEMLLGDANIEEQYNITLYFDKDFEKAGIDKELQLNLYRILQEQLRNILKYAGGANIEVDVLINKNKLKMRISDDGAGFEVAKVKGGIGLSNMKRRVELFSGKFEIFSSPGNGCEIIIDIPLHNETTPLFSKQISISF
jgi:PAS domain S-box-containing protein